jgi:hypothetical protein
MNIGLLYYDDSGKKDLAAKVADAAARYRRKFGAEPDTCYVHPSALDGGKPVQVGGVRVERRATVLAPVLRHHFWIGVEGKMDKTQEQLTVSEIMDMDPQQFELFTDDLREKAQDYRDEQAQARRPL